MKKIQLSTLIKEIINSSKNTLKESVTYDSFSIDGKAIKSEWAGRTSSKDDFIKMIESLPETLRSVKVPVEAAAYLPKEKTFDGPINRSVKSEIVNILDRLEEEYRESGEEIVSYGVSSYYGIAAPGGDTADPAYIQIRTKASEMIGKGLSRGDYGSLD